MKNKVPMILLGCVLVFSVGLNIYLFCSLSETRGQVAVFSSRVVTADEQVTDLQEQLSGLEDLQGQVADLQASLSQSNEQIASLETSLAESNEQITNLESTIRENNATIAELEEQIAENQRQQANTGNSSNGNGNPSSDNRTTPINPMPGSTFEYIPGVSDSGITEPIPGTLGIGTFE